MGHSEKQQRQLNQLKILSSMLRGVELKQRGRPKKNQPEAINVFDELVKSIAYGLPINRACSLSGFSFALFKEFWKQAIDDEAEGYSIMDSDFVLFKHKIEEAKALFVKSQIEIVKTGEKGWQSNAWLLERLEGETFNLNKSASEKRATLPRIEIINDIPVVQLNKETESEKNTNE